MKKCVMIFNSKSGKVKTKETIDEIKNVVNEFDYDLEVLYTKRKGHASSLVIGLSDDVDLVISAGGDGTFHEVISGNLKREKKLLLANLPLGTTNDVGVMYGLNGSLSENLRSILNGEIKNIDVCLANKNPFIYFLGIGNYVDVSYATPKNLKEKYGHLAYVIYALKELKGRLKQYNLEYEVDGVKHDGTYSFIFITNSNHVAGINNVYDDVKLDDNMFEVAFFKINSKLSLIKNLGLLTIMNIEEINDCEYYKTNNLKIKFKNKNEDSWCMDGEEFSIKKKYIDITITKEINILIPRKNVDKLFVNN